jgi:dihydropteroate synthase
VDTYKPKVAEVAIKAGACLINDVTGLRYENGAMATLAARYDLPVIIMHMKGNPRMMQLNPYYQDTVGEIKRFFESRIKLAISRGVNEKKIILDPGIGFGKTLQHNLEIFNRLSEFLSFGRPILIGPSRKSFIAAIVGNIPPQKREGGTIASCLWSVLNGASILRVHDVALVRQALLVFKSISTERR